LGDEVWRVGPRGRWLLKGDEDLRLGVPALGMRLTPVEAAEAKALREDLLEIHRVAASVLQDHGRSPPTLVVTTKDIPDLDLQVEPTTAGTWVVPDDDGWEKIFAELTAAKLGKLSIQVEQHAVVAQTLRSHAEVSGLPPSLRSWLEAASRTSDRWVEARRSERAPSRETLTVEVYQELRAALKRTIEQPDSAWAAAPSPAAHEEGGEGPQRRRLKELQIGNLGGVGATPLTLDLSADLTLIFGPNGTNKTTIARSLALALCGHVMGGTAMHKDTKEGTVVVRWDAGPETTVWVEASQDAPEQRRSRASIRDMKGLPRTGASLLPEAAARLTVLSDEYVSEVLETGLRTPSLSVLIPTSVLGDALRRLVKEETDEHSLNSVLRERRDELDREDMFATETEAWRAIREALTAEVTRPVEALLQRHPGRLEEERTQALLEGVRREDAGRWAVRELEDHLRAGLAGAGDTAGLSGEVSEARLDAVERRLQALHQRFGEPGVALKLLVSDGVGLDQTLEQLLMARRRLEEAEVTVAGEALRRVLAELRGVDVGALEALRAEVHTMLSEVLGARQETERLQKERAALLQALRGQAWTKDLADVTRAVAAWRDEQEAAWVEAAERWRSATRAKERAERRAEERQELEAMADALQKLGEELRWPKKEPGPGAPGAMEAIKAMEAAVNAYAGRQPSLARLGPDLVQLSLDPQDGLTMQVAGRSPDLLSTGQRHQLALAWVVAQRQVFEASERAHELGHRVLVLDDLASSHDQQAVGRESVLLRQLAYGKEEKEKEPTQLILLLHDEELALRYLRVLAPPHGRTMNYIELRPDGATRTYVVEPDLVPDDEPLYCALRRELRFGRPEPERCASGGAAPESS
jgi:hypothetical protein